jgi:Protein of unknown function (DUF3617)
MKHTRYAAAASVFSAMWFPAFRRPQTALSLFVAGCAVLLASCSPVVGTRPETTTNLQRQPGSWTMLHYTMAFDGTGLEGDMAQMVEAGKASVGVKDFGGPVCLSAEQAGKDDLTVRINEAIHFGPEWKVTRSEVKDGMVDFAAAMDDPQQGKGEMTITGQITPTTTDLLVTTDGYQPAPGKGHIHTVMKQENSRVGDCTPGEDAISM